MSQNATASLRRAMALKNASFRQELGEAVRAIQTATGAVASPTMVSLRQACAMTSLSRTFINQLRARGKFPQAVPLGEKRIGFIRSEVEAWIEARIEAARGKNGARTVRPDA